MARSNSGDRREGCRNFRRSQLRRAKTCARSSLAGVLICGLLAVCADAAEGELKRAGMLGIQLAPVTPDVAQAAGLDAPQGILINGTFPRSPAERAGLRQGDILHKMKGEAIVDVGGFIRMMEQYHAHDELEFVLRRDGKDETISFVLGERPRERADDFDILYDSVTVDNNPLRTLITRPRIAGKSPAILFIPDLTPQSLDFWAETMNPPQKSLLYGLTRAGMVTMRVEPPGVGDSKGPHARDAGLSAYVDWYAAGVTKLRECDFVDPQRVYLYSERLGSVIAPMVCKQSAVQGIITFGGMGRNYIESRLADTRRHNVMAQSDPSEDNDIVRGMAQFLAELCLNKKSPTQIVKDHPELEALGGMLVQNENYLLGHHYEFVQTLGSLDPAAAWRGLDTKVLVLFGEADWVSGREDSEALASAINWERRRATFVGLPKTDGTYQTAADAEDSYLMGVGGGEFNPEVIAAISKFIAATSKPED